MTRYEELSLLLGSCDSMSGKNEDNENIMVIRLGDRIKVITIQSNGWLRTNVYHEDGTTEELYDK